MYSLSELTALLEISSKTLNKRFRRATGQTACQYQMDFKLEMVRTFLLEHPNIPLRSVAQNYGFYDEFYLSRMFKKKYGIPPSKIKIRLSAYGDNAVAVGATILARRKGNV